MQQEPGIGSGAEVSEGAQIVGRSPWELARRRFRQDRFAVAGLTFIVIIVIISLGAPWISHHLAHRDPNALYLTEALNPKSFLPYGPSEKFWFGASTAGQDIFSRTLYGARTSLIVAFGATGISVVIGVALGLIAGYYRGRVDTVISRITDVIMSLPILLLALGLVAACGVSATGCLGGFISPGLGLIAMIIGFFNWPYIARIVRGQVFSLREREFVHASIAMGARDSRIVVREVLPNVLAPILVYTTLIIPANIIFEASLSFLGIGVPITTPSWGKMISDASTQFTFAWWTMIFPGLFLFLTTLSFNMVGDGLNDALNPRSAGR